MVRTILRETASLTDAAGNSDPTPSDQSAVAVWWLRVVRSETTDV
jgi:hypothetical protein